MSEFREIPFRLHNPYLSKLKSWEMLLFLVAVAIFIGNSFASPYFLNAWNLSDATFNFTEKAMIAFAMALLIIAGEIDLSVASIIALASTAMGAVAQFDVSTPTLVLVGISYIILGDKAYRGYPEEFAFFGQGYVFWVISFEFVLFVLTAIVFGLLLHKSQFGRTVYAIGNNQTVAFFSGINVHRVKFLLFLLTGLMSGIAAICLTSRLGSTRPSIAFGMELEIVTMVVLGGVNILGGSGSITGVVIAAFVMGLVTFGLGLLNVPGIVMSIFIGTLLILVIAIPQLWEIWRR